MLTRKGYGQFVKHYQQIADQVEELAKEEAKRCKFWHGGEVEFFEIDVDGHVLVEFREPPLCGGEGECHTFVFFDHDLFEEDEDDD